MKEVILSDKPLGLLIDGIITQCENEGSYIEAPNFVWQIDVAWFFASLVSEGTEFLAHMTKIKLKKLKK